MAEKIKINQGKMAKGLTLGKFMPPHAGHLGLIDFAMKRCDEFIIMLCYHSKEPIPGSVRYNWLEKIYSSKPNIHIFQFEYDPLQLSDSSRSSIVSAEEWSYIIKKHFPDIDIFFSSENYGTYIAEFLKARHICFDLQRNIFPISSSLIRSKPAKFWNFIPEVVKPHFIKKIGIVGSESTGKSILTERLAHHYKTQFVAEVARDIICHTKECTYEDLNKIAVEQSKAILAKQNFANKFLFIDTEINTTKSYSKFLFNLELETEEWVEKTNTCDMYIYLQPDCPHIQDGTRLNRQERLYLDLAHKQQFKESKIEYISISGNWEQRFTLSCKVIDEVFLS